MVPTGTKLRFKHPMYTVTILTPEDMLISDIDTAKDLVKQFYPKANDPALTDLLESSKGLKSYRPYFVAAYLIFSEYRRILKADEVTFDYNTMYTVQGLLSMQKAKDVGDTIADQWSVDNLLDQIVNPDVSSNSGVSAFVI